MNPREMLVLAEELIGGDTEAHWRAAVGRGYYAAFHVARLLMQQGGFAVPKADAAHRYLSDWLGNCGHEPTCEAARRLETLRRHRNEADYDLWRRLSRRDADNFVSDAERVIAALEAVQGDAPVLAALVAAMREYERKRGESTWSG